MTTRTHGSLAVIGGGVIGLSVARRAAQDGWSVRVHRTGEPGASWVAGGMLAPHSEGWPGEEELLRLGLESLALWHATGPGPIWTGCRRRWSPRASPWWSPSTAPMPHDLRTVGDWLAAQAIRSP